MLLLVPEAGQDRDEYTGTGYTNCLDKTWERAECEWMREGQFN